MSEQLTGDKQVTTGVDTCSVCKRSTPFHVRNCPYCQADAGFPNVRRAMSTEEVAALATRYASAKAEANDRDSTEKLDEFEKAVTKNSTAIICTPFEDVLMWLKPGRLYTSFHNQVSTGARIAQDNHYDRVRGSVDELLFPEYSEHIIFALLSLNDFGDPYYGDFSIKIREDAIASRATVFHENSIHFFEIKDIKAASEVPAGYRCPWNNRGHLAAAKLSKEIEMNTESEKFENILLKATSDNEKDDSDFIEVHIYGSILGEAIQTITCNREFQEGERHILKNIIRKANQIGLPVELR